MFLHILKPIFLFLCFFYMTVLNAFPVVTSLSTFAGPKNGGTIVKVHGFNFTEVQSVAFGSQLSQNVTVISDTEIHAVAPFGVPGNVNVIVTTTSGSSAASAASIFTYTGSWTLFVTNNSSSSVNVIDADSFSTIVTIPTLSDPVSVVISPDGRQAYIADQLGQIYVVDISSLSITSTIGIPNNGMGISGLSMTPDGKGLYVVNKELSRVAHFYIPDGSFYSSSISSGGENPESMAISPDGKIGYIVNGLTNSVRCLYLTTNSLLKRGIGVGLEPVSAKITPNGQFLYVVNKESGTVSVIQTSTHIVIATIFVGKEPIALAIDRTGTFVYVVNRGSSTISKISIESNTVVATLETAPMVELSGIVLAPDDKIAYVVHDSPASEVFRIDLKTFTLIPGIVPVGSSSSKVRGIAISPDQGPVAHFTVAPCVGLPGVPETFDASTSVSPVGTIVSYNWDFGDGIVTTTPLPTIMHNYETSGAFKVTLKVTNSAGNSYSQVFTGQTATLHGSPFSITAQTFHEAPLPPMNMAGVTMKDKTSAKTNMNRITFTPSTDPRVTGYYIFRNGVLIGSIPAAGPFTFDDPGRTKGFMYLYSIVSFDALGVMSPSVTIAL